MQNYKRLIILGDVHGCIDELSSLLEEIKFNKEQDRLIFCGDLLDRGPNSGAVVKFVRENNFECVLGNHEYKHVNYYLHDTKKQINNNHKNPIRLSEDKKRTHLQLSEDDLKWFLTLPKKIFIKEHNLLVVHAGVLPDQDPLKQMDYVYMFCRYIDQKTHKLAPVKYYTHKPENSIFWTDIYDGDINIVYGHHVHNLLGPHIAINKNGAKTIGLDTGCVFGGNLTALIIENNNYKFFQVSSKMNYFKR